MSKIAFRIKLILAMMLAFLVAQSATAQSTPVRISGVEYYHDTIGTTASGAIPSISVKALFSFKVCADAGNASYVAVSKALDPDTDGVRLQAGQCFECLGCVGSTLKALKVKGGAASQGYSVLQYLQ
jgi:hypothetical protein